MELQRMNFDADVARLIRGLGLSEAIRPSKISGKAVTPQPQGKLMLWGWIALSITIPAMFGVMAYIAAPRTELEAEADAVFGTILLILSQPIPGWLGCILVARAVSHRPYWVLALLTFVTCGPVGIAIWFFGLSLAPPIVIGPLAALGAGLAALVVGRLMRK
jgi:hypothetical protein